MPSFRKITKAEKSLICVGAFVILPLAGIVYLYGGRDAEPNWDIPPAVRIPKPNGYDFYVAATRARVYFSPPVDSGLDTSGVIRNSPSALKNFSLARHLQWLKANARTFALVNRGLNTPSVAPEHVGDINHDLSHLRELAIAMSVRTRTFQMQRQPMRATMSALDTMQMGQDVSRGANELGRQVGIAIMEIGRRPLDDWNKTINALGANEARTAARRLETLLAHEPTAAQTITAEKWEKLLELRQLFNTQGWRGSWGSQEIMDGVHETPGWIWQRQMTSKQTIYNNRARFFDRNIASSKLPYSQAKIPIPGQDSDVFNWYLSPTNWYCQREASVATSNTMLLLRLALRASIAEHGVAPPTLAALVPGTLKAIPADVYSDGKPLFYQPQGKTYKLWSVGPDGINNGGVPFARTPQDKPGLPPLVRLDNTGDFVAGLCR